MAGLAQHGMWDTDARRDRTGPLLALLVGTNDQGLVDLLCDPIGQQWRGVQGRGGNGVDRRERWMAVQMGVYREQLVERRRDQACEGPRRHAFPIMKSLVLPHVGQIRRNQVHLAGAKLARGIGGEH